MNSHVVIVDPHSTESLLAERLRAQGFALVALHTQHPIPEGLARNFRRELFAVELTHSPETISRLRQYSCVAVIAGDDTGVRVADEVSEALGVASNGARLSAIRNSKYEIQEHLRACGLRALRQARVLSEAEVDAALDRWSPGPTVVKPGSSQGSDGVSLVHTRAEIRRAALELLSHRNAMGLQNFAVLIQEYVEGTEYVVDAVTIAGKHHVAAVCRYDKHAANGAAFVYFAADIISPTDTADPNVARIIEYAHAALDALQVKVGPTHMEIKVDGTGPVLIESHGRLHGGVAPRIFTRTYEPDLLTLTEKAYTDPSAGKDFPRRSRLTAFGRIVFIVSEEQGIFAGYSKKARGSVEALPSFRQMLELRKQGEVLERTVDLWTCPTIIILTNADQAALDHDTALVREWLRPRDASRA